MKKAALGDLIEPGYLSTPGAWFPCFPQTKETDKLFIPQTISGDKMSEQSVRVQDHMPPRMQPKPQPKPAPAQAPKK
ncbi:hypothetical protein [Scandinavium goeteborgense]|uniref:hypothetical protein n=1 Tax=Scandinavium goeteborgense TaxID=1851514 RepID=UPI000F662812|nr:hypothetical protein [Scandinavium goeteborgense]QKN82100.1 hypothetical protein A8O29_012685 [Scandinavium goeteborgense]